MADQPKLGLLIIGVGNRFRRDDAAGLGVAQLLKDMRLDSSMILEHSGEGASLMAAWKGADAVILIDAVSSGSAPGAIHRLDPVRKPLPAELFHSSTHAFSLPHAIEMARALDELPRRLVVFGIEGLDFRPGTGLSTEVRKALPQVAKRVLEEVSHLEGGDPHGD